MALVFFGVKTVSDVTLPSPHPFHAVTHSLLQEMIGSSRIWLAVGLFSGSYCSKVKYVRYTNIDKTGYIDLVDQGPVFQNSLIRIKLIQI